MKGRFKGLFESLKRPLKALSSKTGLYNSYHKSPRTIGSHKDSQQQHDLAVPLVHIMILSVEPMDILQNKNVFLFSGQGSQYYGMGAELYENDMGFKAHMDELDEIPRERINTSITGLLYRESHPRTEPFVRTLYTHPAIFMVEYALARTLMDAGIVPDCLMGASLGEYVALALAEVLPVKKVLELIIDHGQRVETTCAPGTMIGIIGDPALYRQEPILHENSSLVGISSPWYFVVSGFARPMEKIKAFLEENKRLFQVLPISYGFHSPNIDPAQDALGADLAMGMIQPPKIKIISCLTGERLNRVDRNYLRDIARQPILFPQALQTLCSQGANCLNLIDLGPGGTSAGFVRQNKMLKKGSKTYRVLTHFGHGMRNLEKIKREVSGGKGENGNA